MVCKCSINDSHTQENCTQSRRILFKLTFSSNQSYIIFIIINKAWISNMDRVTTLHNEWNVKVDWSITNNHLALHSLRVSEADFILFLTPFFKFSSELIRCSVFFHRHRRMISHFLLPVSLWKTFKGVFHNINKQCCSISSFCLLLQDIVQSDYKVQTTCRGMKVHISTYF